MNNKILNSNVLNYKKTLKLQKQNKEKASNCRVVLVI